MTAQIVLTTANLDGFISEARAVLERDGYAAWSAHVGNRAFVAPEGAPKDPFGDAFRDFQLDLWQLVAGRRAYDPHSHERDPNLVSVKDIRQSYPFCTASTSEVYCYFSAILQIYRHLDLMPPARIVDFGAGWGHSTRFLANAGFDVTAVDIEPAFLEMLDRFSIPGTLPVRRQHCSFTSARFAKASLDAAVFFECFHHCLDNAKLLYQLSRSLKRGGKIVLASEPVYDGASFPYPWGLRLDGHAVWAIRSLGWLELGFRKSYLQELLRLNGFSDHWIWVDGLARLIHGNAEDGL
jgi:SAM-dependent methyltransferase